MRRRVIAAIVIILVSAVGVVGIGLLSAALAEPPVSHALAMTWGIMWGVCLALPFMYYVLEW